MANLEENPSIYITDYYKKEEAEVWKAYDFLYPGGKLATLVRVSDINAKAFPYSDIMNKLKLTEGYPILNLIGSGPGKDRDKFWAGVSRACFNVDALIMQNCISSGIEKSAMRKGLNVIGVAPENEV